MIRFFNHYFMIFAMMTCAWSLSSCQDDDLVSGGAPEEGHPATVKFRVNVGDMEAKTRSIIDEPAQSYCDNLWVGIYMTSDGKRVYSHLFEEEFENTSEVEGMPNEMQKLEVAADVTSGAAVIVAVSNLDNEMATRDVGADQESLRTALEAADTWEAYKKIVVHKENLGEPAVRTGTLMMSGYYSGADTSGDMDGVPVVFIQPGVNEFSGEVDLYRLTSYNKVNITVGEHISAQMRSWKVGNIPTDSYLFEHNDGSVYDNAGSSMAASDNPYADSNVSRNFSKEDDVFNFEFYQYENKHTGLSSVTSYGDREREYKNGDDSNTGIYCSLVADQNDDVSLLNNNASYFVFTADLDYYIEDTPTNRATPEDAKPVAYDATKALIHRTATATYTVHLGYCENKKNGEPTAETCQDFNCRRNTKYTYNVKILGVNQIIVEAKKNGEPQPGAEGTVYDDYGDYVTIDSHYGVFNIKLSNVERKTLLYNVSAPYNGTTYTFTSADYQASDEDDELYKWIKFKPTTGKDVLAVYKVNENDNNLWSLHDLVGADAVSNHPWGNWTINDDGSVKATDEDTDPDSETDHYYTVFIDEYVYHKGRNGIADESDGVESLWYTYVNQDPRVAELLDKSSVSSDTESDYSFCKYSFAQKSIQTYYKFEGGDHVLGVEHTDENYGLNYAWRYMTPTGGNTYNVTDEKAYFSAENGRWNAKRYMHGVDSIAGYDGSGFLWSKYVNWTTPDDIPAGYSSGSGASHEAASYPVPMMGDLTGGRGSGYYWNNVLLHYAEAACLNRNRDLDGNGKIDDNEIRWYLPTGNRYVYIGQCQSELEDPLMPFMEHSKMEFFANPYLKFQYHFIASNCQHLYGEECVSVGDRPVGYALESQMCYAVRCIRNLGTDPASTLDPTLPPSEVTSEISSAFTHDASTRTITMDRYTDATLRSYTHDFVLPHDVGAEEGRTYKKMKYAKDYCKNISDPYVSVGGGGVMNFNNANNEGTKCYRWYQSLLINGICGQYTEESDKSDLGTWRVPSFKELAVLYTEGLCTTDMLTSSRGHFEESYNNGYSALWPYAFFGFNDTGDRHLPAKDVVQNRSGNIHIRCVKDVK
jgi:hypothetical protein